MNKLSNLFVVSAASGTGKTSLVRALIATIDNLEISISYTTRSPRPNDVEGQDYFFVGIDEFQEMVNKQAFLEYAQIYGNYYGTARHWVETKLAQGIDIILEIDWQGAVQIHKILPEAVLIFLLPPSLEALRERLLRRQQDAPQIIAERLASAQQEITYYSRFEYLVINEEFDHALTDLRYIVLATRLRRQRQEQQQASLLEHLLKV